MPKWGESWSALLFVVHASAGVGGLVAGLASLSSPRPSAKWRLRRLYVVCIALLLGSMVVVAIDWKVLAPGVRVAFVALTALGAVMAYRLARAFREASVVGRLA